MAVRNIGRFKADLREFARLVEVDVGRVRRKVSLDLFGKIVRRTPVLDGRLVSSWALSDDAPQVVDPVGREGKVSRAEAEANARANITATFTDPFGVSYIATGIPYGPRVEFDSWSKKAPSGMVRISLAEVEAELEAFKERLR